MSQITMNYPINSLQNNRKLKNVKSFGDQAMSYSALQEGMQEFRHPAFKGFIAYMPVWGVNYVLSDPITPKKDYLKATMLFLERNKNAVFVQISEEYATWLSYLKFSINGLGVEHIVDLPSFKVTWKKRKCLKSWLSKLNNLGYSVFEYPADPRRVNEINSEWLQAKQTGKELRFQARPFVNNKEEDVRYFYLIKGNSVLGFCSFDPIYSDGEVVSYTLQHLRVCDEAILGSQDFLLLNALFQFKEEGCEKISLGLSPLYQRDNGQFQSSKLADLVFNGIYRTSFLYNYRTIGEHKDHYKAEKKQSYVAFPNRVTIKQLCGIMKVNNLI